MTPQKYTKVLVLPESKWSLRLWALDLSRQFGRWVSMNEALVLGAKFLHESGVEMEDPRAATDENPPSVQP